MLTSCASTGLFLTVGLGWEDVKIDGVVLLVIVSSIFTAINRIQKYDHFRGENGGEGGGGSKFELDTNSFGLYA